MQEGNVFTLSVCSHWGGGSLDLGMDSSPPSTQTWIQGTPTPLDLGLRYPQPDLGLGYPPDLELGYPPPPTRTWNKGTPHTHTGSEPGSCTGSEPRREPDMALEVNL